MKSDSENGGGGFYDRELDGGVRKTRTNRTITNLLRGEVRGSNTNGTQKESKVQKIW